MRIFVVRHGDKAKGNYPNPALGHNDQPLSDAGREQARSLARFFADKEIATIRVSEYARTTETAAPFAAAAGLVPMVDPLLNEIDTGCIDDMDSDEAALRFPAFFEAYSKRETDFTYPEGESGADVLARIRKTFARCQGEPGNKLLLTHEAWTKLVMCHVLGLPGEARFHFHVDTCGILELEVDEERGGFIVHCFNHTVQ